MEVSQTPAFSRQLPDPVWSGKQIADRWSGFFEVLPREVRDQGGLRTLASPIVRARLRAILATPALSAI